MLAFQLLFRTGDRVYADYARANTARLLDAFQPDLLGALMHYTTNGNGTRVTAQGFPPVHFQSVSDGFGLLGFGPDAAAHVREAARPIAEAWSRHLSRPVLLGDRTVSIGIEWRPYPVRYCIPKLVVQKKARHLGLLSNEATGRAFIAALIERSIRTQAAFLGMEVPSGLAINFISSTGSFGAKLGHGGATLAGLRNAVFDANVGLSGFWSFGYISSKGYGLLNADRVNGGIIHALP